MPKLELTRTPRAAVIGALAGFCLPLAAAAQDADRPGGEIVQLSEHMGEMVVALPDAMRDAMPYRIDRDGVRRRDTLQFEPFQMVGELFRSDIVFLMRHGPTDWSKRDVIDVAPGDCANQRLLSSEGRARMVDMGILLAANELRPARILASEWCRNQATLEALMEGIGQVDPDYARSIEILEEPALNLLLSLQGAPDTARMEEIVADWDGGAGDGPLLLLTHYTNIDEMTNFSVFEGEMLLVDPKRESRVMGYVRLKSAAPDVGHFP